MQKNDIGKILAIGTTILFIGSCVLPGIIGLTNNAIHFNDLNQIPYKKNRQSEGNTLITEFYGGRVFEVDRNGTIVWEITGLNWPNDAERLYNGNTLITEYGIDRIIEVDKNGNIVWQKTGLHGPRDAEELHNGNILVTEYFGHRIIEIDRNGKIVSKITGLYYPCEAERIYNGNTLITEILNARVIEVDRNGNIVWKRSMYGPNDAERLFNGNTLLIEYLNNRVREIDSTGNTVWERYRQNSFPPDAERLLNGNTLISERENNRVIEVDSFNNIVWEITGLNDVIDAERIIENQQPDRPVINGQTNGIPERSYSYSFIASDPDGDDVYIKWDWDDDYKTLWHGPFQSGIKLSNSHSWSKKGNYTIRVVVRDEYEAISIGDLKINILRNRASSNTLFSRFLDMFPILQKIVKNIL
jgi:hypothetical protein